MATESSHEGLPEQTIYTGLIYLLLATAPQKTAERR